MMHRHEHTVAHADLAAFVFLANKEHKSIQLDLQQLGSTKELFYFLLHLLCKGLILLFGLDNSVSIDTLDVDKLYQINQKLQCIGIRVHILTQEIEQERLGVFYHTPDNSSQLADNKLEMYSRNMHHTLWFEPHHYLQEMDQRCHAQLLPM